MPAEYRFLSPEEIIQIGDEFWTGTSETSDTGHWHPCCVSIGIPVERLQTKPHQVRRPIKKP